MNSTLVLFPIAEAARRMAISAAELRRLVREGGIPSERDGRFLKISSETLREWFCRPRPGRGPKFQFGMGHGDPRESAKRSKEPGVIPMSAKRLETIARRCRDVRGVERSRNPAWQAPWWLQMIEELAAEIRRHREVMEWEIRK